MDCLLARRRAASSDGLAPCGPGNRKTPRCATSRSSYPRSRSRSSMRPRTVSQGIRSSAPIRGGPKEPSPDLVKTLDFRSGLIVKSLYHSAGGTASTMIASSRSRLHAGKETPMHAQTQPLRIDPADETIRLGPLGVRFLITGEDANGSVALFELTVPAAQRLAAPAHSHDHYEETVYGLEGVLTWTVDGKRIAVGPGQALCIPRGAVHRFDNHGSGAPK